MIVYNYICICVFSQHLQAPLYIFLDAIYPDLLKLKRGNMQVSNDDLKVLFLFERTFGYHSMFFFNIFNVALIFQ